MEIANQISGPRNRSYAQQIPWPMLLTWVGAQPSQDWKVGRQYLMDPQPPTAWLWLWSGGKASFKRILSQYKWSLCC